MDERAYPADPAEAGLALFQQWLGASYARSTSIDAGFDAARPGWATLRVGRQWQLDALVLDTISPASNVEFEATRAAIERRLDADELSVVLWLPRGMRIPKDEPELSGLVAAIREAETLPDGRLEVRWGATIHLRRTSTDGSVVTALGGLAPHWARFTSKVPGTFQLNSFELSRLPAGEDERQALFDRIVMEASQPTIDEGVEIRTAAAWSANALRSGRAYVLSAPAAESDETAAGLRRTVRQQLRAGGGLGSDGDARALVVLGLATYAEDEKLSWVVRGLEPALLASFDFVVVVADGITKPLIKPAANTLPWDAPLTRR